MKARPNHTQFVDRSHGKRGDRMQSHMAVDLRIGIIQINVTDLDEAWEFYVNKLGVSGVQRMGRGRPFELILSSAVLVLVYPATTVLRNGYPTSTGVILVFYTD